MKTFKITKTDLALATGFVFCCFVVCYMAVEVGLPIEGVN